MNEETNVVSAWSTREKELLMRIEKHIARYKRFAVRSRKAGRALSIITLICTVLAPVTVVSSVQHAPSSLSAFGLSSDFISSLAVVVTITLALTEGLRRTFRFEHRWAASVVAGITIEKEKTIYLDNQVGKATGSSEWIANLLRLRDTVDNVTHSEAQEFFQTVLSQDKELSSANKPTA